MEATPSAPEGFNPLEVAAQPLDDRQRYDTYRRTIANIVDSYHGNYDVFAELLQNAVDAVHQRYLEEGEPYEPKIWVEIDQASNRITVCDNGVGIPQAEFESVLAPNVSFKDPRSTGKRSFRGHKGVGLSYLAYGFNYLRISTTTGDFSRSGEIQFGRTWISGALELPPLVKPTPEASTLFENLSRGTAITVQLDSMSRPKSLSHLATSASEWARILRAHTALGMVYAGDEGALPLEAEVKVRRPNEGDSTTDVETQFLFPHLMNAQKGDRVGNKYLDLGKYYSEHPNVHTVATKHKRNHGIYRYWEAADRSEPALGLSEEDLRWAEENGAWFYGFMSYSTDFWKENRADGQKSTSAYVVKPGLVFASEQMTIGDYQEISLNRYTGRQKQVTVVLHVDGLRPDLGRKSFEDEVVQRGQSIARHIVEWFSKGDRHRVFLRAPSDKKVTKSISLEDWKFDARQWLGINPLRWGHEEFPLLSDPRQEQDVVILFSQLISRGIIPGIKVLGAAEGNQQYDSLMRISYSHADATAFSESYVQGLHPEVLNNAPATESPIIVTEFKFELASLIRDVGDDTKTFTDIDLAIAWRAGSSFSGGQLDDYALVSTLLPETVVDRDWPGVTHLLRKSGSDHTVRVVLLEDLFRAANDWQASVRFQTRNYSEE